MTKNKLSGLLASGKLKDADQAIVSRMPQLKKIEIDSEDQKENNVDLIDIDLIDESPYQPRIKLDQDKLQSLADSIESSTLIEKITVRKKESGRYELISGERRWRAHKLLGHTQVPAYIKILSDKDAALLSLASNTAREDLSDYELGVAFNKLISNKHVKNVAELAKYTGISRQQIDRCLDYIKLPDIIIDMLNVSPRLFGANCAEIFASYLDKGFINDVIKAAEMIGNGDSEKKAITWLRNNTSSVGLRRTRSKNSVSLFLNNSHFGDAYIEKNSVVIKCNHGTKPSDVLKNIESLFQEKSL